MVEDWVDAEEATMKAAYGWFMRNKLGMSAVCGFISGMLFTGLSTGSIPDAQWLHTVAFVLSYTAMGLGGAGVLKSDDYYRDKQGK